MAVLGVDAGEFTPINGCSAESRHPDIQINSMPATSIEIFISDTLQGLALARFLAKTVYIP